MKLSSLPAIAWLASKVILTSSFAVTVTGTDTILQGTIFETSGGIQFEVDEETAIDTSGDVSVTAKVAGVAGNVAASSITVFPDTLTGVTAISNAEALTGGADAVVDTTTTLTADIAAFTFTANAIKNCTLAELKTICDVLEITYDADATKADLKALILA